LPRDTMRNWLSAVSGVNNPVGVDESDY